MCPMIPSDDFRDRPTAIVKLSTRLLTERPQTFLEDVAEVIKENRRRWNIVIVASGSIGLAMQAQRALERPTELEKLQRLASLGQTRLMRRFEEAFALQPERPVAQLLLTHDDLAKPSRAQGIANQLALHFASGSIPVVNENDTVSNKEITFGDNDQLAARLSVLLGAHKLVLLTHSVPGLLDKRGALVEKICGVPDKIYALAGESDSPSSKGGAKSKLLAAALANAASPQTRTYIIGDADLPQKLAVTLADGSVVGTTILRGPVGALVQDGLIKCSLGLPHR